MKKLITSVVAFFMLPLGSGFASSTTSIQDSVIQSGMNYLGAPYQFGAPLGDTRSFDCSSFSAQIFAENGITLPRVSRDQARQGVSVSKSQLQKGDLVFYDTNFDGQINHLGVYIQTGQMIHASTSIGVSITDPFSSYWGPRFVTARRVIPQQVVAPETQVRQHQNGVYTVRSGDSLSVIARDFGVTVEQLRDWNKLTGDVILVGQQLVVVERPVSVVLTNTVHTVRSGDTLWGISRQYSVSVDQLMSWNSLTSSTIHIGQSLVISTPQPTVQTHVVQAGDTLWRIATNHHMSVERLMAINYLQSSIIHPGQVLKVS